MAEGTGAGVKRPVDDGRGRVGGAGAPAGRGLLIFFRLKADNPLKSPDFGREIPRKCKDFETVSQRFTAQFQRSDKFFQIPAPSTLRGHGVGLGRDIIALVWRYRSGGDCGTVA